MISHSDFKLHVTSKKLTFGEIIVIYLVTHTYIFRGLHRKLLKQRDREGEGPSWR